MKRILIMSMAIALAACGKSASDDNAPLAFVPADTGYVFANLEATPRKVSEAWFALLAPLEQAYLETLDLMRAEMVAEADPEDARRILAVMELLEDKFSLQGWENIGFDIEGRAAIYGVDLVPVVRVELADPDKLRAFIGELETRSGVSAPVAETDGQPYWRVPLGDGKPLAVVTAIIGDHLVLTLDTGEVPANRLLGLVRPEQSLQDSEELESINRQYGFAPHGTFLIDNRRVLTGLLGGDGEDTWFTRLLSGQGHQVSPECRTEYQAMIARSPRLVAGYTRLDERAQDTTALLELDSALATPLAALPAPVPGLGSSRDGIEFGFGLKLDKLAEFLQAQAGAIRSAPFTCETLAPMNELAEQLGSQVAGLYMAAGWFSGARTHVRKLTMDENNMPVDIEGSMLLASPNPTSLIAMAQGFVPQLAQIQLSPGAEPQRIDLSELGAGDHPEVVTWAAMSDQAIGIGFGANGGEILKADLAAAADAPHPVLHVGYEGALYAQVMDWFQTQAATSSASSPDSTDWQVLPDDNGFDFDHDPDGDTAEGRYYGEDEDGDASPFDDAPAPDGRPGHQELAERMMEPFNKAMVEFYSQIDHVTTDVVFTERGIEIRGTSRLK